MKTKKIIILSVIGALFLIVLFSTIAIASGTEVTTGENPGIDNVVEIPEGDDDIQVKTSGLTLNLNVKDSISIGKAEPMYKIGQWTSNGRGDLIKQFIGRILFNIVSTCYGSPFDFSDCFSLCLGSCFDDKSFSFCMGYCTSICISGCFDFNLNIDCNFGGFCVSSCESSWGCSTLSGFGSLNFGGFSFSGCESSWGCSFGGDFGGCGCD